MNSLKSILKLSDYSLREGIYLVPEVEQEIISYPSSGHDSCFSVEDNSFWFNHRNKCIISMVEKYASNQTFFDVGGGNGFVSKGLLENKIEAVLVEPGVSGCFNAKRRNIDNVLCMTFSNLYFLSNELKISVGLFDVIEHIENDYKFLKDIYDKIPSGSKLFITVPAYQELWSDEDELAGHFRRYTSQSLGNLTKRVGFKTVYQSYIFSFLPVPILLLRTLPFMMKKFFGKNTVKKLSSVESDHAANDNLKSNFLDKLLSIERYLLKRRIPIPFGGSIIHIIEKK